MKKLKRNSLKAISGGKLDCYCQRVIYQDGSTSGDNCATEFCTQISFHCGQRDCWPTPIE
ncbi:hypothetical protein ATE49_12615 [Elizabethkingia miricola]|uniref:Bacteriocin n=2 Tax=Elizabethkingia miricola TaxID=172045 RepID=A0ABD5BBV6_ELIMR|nr:MULTISPECIES: hypothetical protein [Elizabethkingia]MDV2448965.1 hypothetical protein [Elizabethkingia anophelis]KUG10756.1 hypothetical protein AMC91_15705 [Elizabethkingia miricola]MCL1658139.1 hypothetical protein [Elizabethkingia miricola]MCP1253216.1 hypothetical protein [Elizabethkingia sp. S0634]MDQ8750991.1 hypothetical protein [Elizabethkingia miricola]